MKIIYKIITVIVLLASFASCDNKLESNDYYMADRAAFIQFQQNEDNFLIKEDIENVYDVKVRITGMQDNDATYAVTIDPASTAVEGVDFDIAGLSSSISAGNLFDAIQVTGYYDAASLEGKSLILNIESNDVHIGVINKFELTLMKFCPIEADFTGTYVISKVSGGLDGFFEFTPIWGDGTQVDITVGDTETERAFSASYYPALGSFPASDLKFSLICGNTIMSEHLSSVSCDGGVTPLGVAPSTTGNATYSFDDDTTFNIIFTENQLGACGEVAVTTEYMFTKM
ncbi:MAG TPA: hypothetical protein EYG92_00295 [Lutibacter sp.]|nr:hypothetical protein [Lutibacter sp.]